MKQRVTEQTTIVIHNWPLKPELPFGAREAIRLLRENPNGYEAVHGWYADPNNGRCAIGMLRGEGYQGPSEAEEFCEDNFGFSLEGIMKVTEEFDTNRLCFSQMARRLEQTPERYFNFKLD